MSDIRANPNGWWSEYKFRYSQEIKRYIVRIPYSWNYEHGGENSSLHHASRTYGVYVDVKDGIAIGYNVFSNWFLSGNADYTFYCTGYDSGGDRDEPPIKIEKVVETRLLGRKLNSIGTFL